MFKNTILNYTITALFFLSLLSIEFLATTTLEIKAVHSLWDKANHFIAFFVLYTLLYFSHFALKRVTTVALLLLFGIQIEIVQYFIPLREFSLLDVFADSVGIAIGFVLSAGLAKFLEEKSYVREL